MTRKTLLLGACVLSVLSFAAGWGAARLLVPTAPLTALLPPASDTIRAPSLTPAPPDNLPSAAMVALKAKAAAQPRAAEVDEHLAAYTWMDPPPCAGAPTPRVAVNLAFRFWVPKDQAGRIDSVDIHDPAGPGTVTSYVDGLGYYFKNIFGQGRFYSAWAPYCGDAPCQGGRDYYPRQYHTGAGQRDITLTAKDSFGAAVRTLRLGAVTLPAWEWPADAPAGLLKADWKGGRLTVSYGPADQRPAVLTVRSVNPTNPRDIKDASVPLTAGAALSHTVDLPGDHVPSYAMVVTQDPGKARMFTRIVHFDPLDRSDPLCRPLNPAQPASAAP